MSQDKQFKLNKFDAESSMSQPVLKFLAQNHQQQQFNMNNSAINMNNSNCPNDSYSSESSKNAQNMQTKPYSSIQQMQQIYKNQQKYLKKSQPNNTSQSDSQSQKKKRTSYKAELDTNSRPREKRVKERTILYVLKKVVRWRQVYDKSVKGQDTSNMNVGQYKTANLKQAAEYVQLSRKTLDDYFSMIRRGYNYNFDFRNKYKEKMGVLRQHIKEIENNGGKMKSKGVDVFKIWNEVTEGRQIDINDCDEDDMDSGEYMDEGYQETSNGDSNNITDISDITRKKMKVGTLDDSEIIKNRIKLAKQNCDQSMNYSMNKSVNITSENQNNNNSLESESSDQQRVLINPAFNQVIKEKYAKKQNLDGKKMSQNLNLMQSQSIEPSSTQQQRMSDIQLSKNMSSQQNGKQKKKRSKQSQKQQNKYIDVQNEKLQNQNQMGQFGYQQNANQDFMQQSNQQQFGMGMPFQNFQMPFGSIQNNSNNNNSNANGYMFNTNGQKIKENQNEMGKNNQQMVDKNYQYMYNMYNIFNNDQLEKKIKDFSRIHFDKIFEQFNNTQKEHWSEHLKKPKIQKLDEQGKKFKVLKFRTYSLDDFREVNNKEKEVQDYGFPYFKIYDDASKVKQTQEQKEQIKEIKQKWNKNFTENKEKLINMAMNLDIPSNDIDFKNFSSQFQKNGNSFMNNNYGMNQFSQAFMMNQPGMFMDPTMQMGQGQIFDPIPGFQQPFNQNKQQNGNQQQEQQQQKQSENGISMSNKQLSFQKRNSTSQQQQELGLNKKLSSKLSGDQRNGTINKKVMIVQQGKINNEQDLSDKQNSQSEQNSNNSNNEIKNQNNKNGIEEEKAVENSLDKSNAQNNAMEIEQSKQQQQPVSKIEPDMNMEEDNIIRNGNNQEKESTIINNNSNEEQKSNNEKETQQQNTKKQINKIIKPILQTVKQED